MLSQSVQVTDKLGPTLTPAGDRAVHLLHIYSNTPELVTDLEAVTWTVRRIDLQDVPALPSTERVSRLRDRLSEPEMAAVVASYSGTSVTQLTRQYDINH